MITVGLTRIVHQNITSGTTNHRNRMPFVPTNVVLRIERNGANGPLRFDLDNLPHGVIVGDLGLNGITLLKGQNRRVLSLKADDWVPATTRSFHAVCRSEGNQASQPMTLHVRRGDDVAGTR